MMQTLAKVKFSSFALKVPTDWQQPSGDPAGKHYVDSFPPSERVAVPDVTVPPLFLPASLNKYHVDTQKNLNQKFGGYIDGICSAICSAWSTWQSSAAMTGIMVNAVTASVGQVIGAPWTPLILASAPKATPMETLYSTTVATALGMGWLSYTATIKIPGLPFYPAFAAFPGPFAAPMPNVPVPVIALTQVTATVGAGYLKSQMVAMLGQPTAPFHKELFESIADSFEKCFLMWQGTTMVTNVLGMGPIPSFVPPFVPVGPVVGGMGNMPPGGFV
jgi:hypothetical protein